MPTSTLKHKPLIGILSQLTTLLGYAGPNAALYTEGSFAALAMVIDLLLKELNNNSGNNIDIGRFLNDELHVTAFVIIVVAMVLLTMSNQNAYSNMIEELLNGDQLPQPSDFKGHLKEFIETCANLIGTHFKAIVTTASMWRMLERFIKNPYLSGALTGLIILPCAELAQFAILGRKQDSRVFTNGLISFIQSVVFSSLAWAITYYLVNANSAPFVTLLTWGVALMADTMVIAATKKTSFYSLFSCVVGNTRDQIVNPVLVLNTENNVPPKSDKTPWYFWRTSSTKKDNQSEQEQSLISRLTTRP